MQRFPAGIFFIKVADDLPVYTSTPIVNRQDSLNVQPVFAIIKRLDRMESELREFKQTVVSSMEPKIQELRTIIISTLDKMIAEKTYASAVQGQNQSNHGAATRCYNHAEVIHNPLACSQEQLRSDQSSDEGFFNNSTNLSGSSQTSVNKNLK